MARTAKAKPAKKPRTSDRRYESATVTVADISSSKFRTSGMDQLVKRYVGTSAFCAGFNARNLASCKFVLYRQKKQGASDGRGLTRREKEWVRKSGPNGPGIKAASRANSADDIEAVEEHPVLDLIRDPNPRDTGFEFWEAHHTCKEISGNAFALVVASGSLETLPPQYVRIEASRDGIVGGYVYGRSRDIEVGFLPEEVLHERFAKSLFEPYYGAGPLAQIIMPHDIRVAMNEWSLAVFDKMARPDYAIIFKQALGDKQKQQAREEVKRRYQGQQNIGEVMILSGGEATIQPLGWNPKELDYDAGRKTIDTEICTAFGVPETFLRPNEGALSQARSMMEWYARNTLLPRANKHAEWLTERVLTLFTDNGDSMWFAVENPVPQDEALQAQRAQVLVTSGVMTINEARYEVGLDSAEEAGANLLRVNGVPLDKVGAMPSFGGFDGTGDAGADDDRPTDGGDNPPSDPPKGDTGGNANDDPAGGKAGPSPDDKGNDNRDDGPGSGVGNGSVDCCKPGVKVVSQKELWAKESPSPLYRANIDPMEEVCRKFFKAQLKATLAEMEEKPSGYQKHGRMAIARKASDAAMNEARRLLVVWGVDDEKWVKFLADRLIPLSEERMVTAAVQAISTIQGMADVLEDAKPENFTLANPRAAKWAERNTADLLKACGGINRTTADRLAMTLAEGVEAGENISDMRKRIKAAYEEAMPGGESMSDYRANMIARTETARAKTSGTLAGWDASGVVEGKQWLVSPDACEFCIAAGAEFNGKTVPLAQSFYGLGSTVSGADGGTLAIDFAAVDAPPLHPHCKCDCVAVVRGVNQ